MQAIAAAFPLMWLAELIGFLKNMVKKIKIVLCNLNIYWKKSQNLIK